MFAEIKAFVQKITSSDQKMKLSVVLANFNHGAMISGAIEAILSQSYKNWELIIVDDGSTDNSQAVIGAYALRDSRIKPIFFPENRGFNAAFRSGMDKASGELLYGAAADDFLSDDEFFACAVEAIALNPTVAGVFSRTRVISGSDGRELWTMGSAPQIGLNPQFESLTAFFENRIFVPGSSAIWKLSLVREFGGFDPTLGPQSDYFINHALPAIGGVIFIDKISTSLRLFNTSYSSDVSDDDFFNRHALVEVKLKMLPVAAGIPPEKFYNWRDSIINGRLGYSRQRPLYDAIRIASDHILPHEERSLPDAFLSLLEHARRESNLLSEELERRILVAHSIFDKISGKIQLIK